MAGNDLGAGAKDTVRIAHVSPLPPQQTGIADYCASLLPYVAEVIDVDVFGLPETAVSNFPVHPISTLAEKRLALADSDQRIQGYDEGVFWERNSKT